MGFFKGFPYFCEGSVLPTEKRGRVSVYFILPTEERKGLGLVLTLMTFTSVYFILPTEKEWKGLA